jgi:hypothetical protein
MIEPIEISLADLKTYALPKLKKGECLTLMESDFPECSIVRHGKFLICELQEHIYTKYWEHKFHATVFAQAMLRAVRRLAFEGQPLSNPAIQNDDAPHIFVTWQLALPVTTPNASVILSIRDSWNEVWQRANSILEDSDSVLVLGKDTGPGMKRLKEIATVLEDAGYHVYIIKEQPDKLGESIIQKVLRYALMSRFVIIENTTPSGHLYEVPHVTKMAECITAVLQEKGKGATWMFEDAYPKSKAWRKFSYTPVQLSGCVIEAANWAQKTLKHFAGHQRRTLPWLRKK